MLRCVISKHKHGICDGQKRQVEGTSFICHVDSQRCLSLELSPLQYILIQCNCVSVAAYVLGQVTSFPFQAFAVKETSFRKLSVCIFIIKREKSGVLEGPVLQLLILPGTFLRALYTCWRSLGISRGDSTALTPSEPCRCRMTRLADSFFHLLFIFSMIEGFVRR